MHAAFAHERRDFVRGTPLAERCPRSARMDLDKPAPSGHHSEGRHTSDRKLCDEATGDGRDKVHILENGVASSDPDLGLEVERHVLELLTPEDMAGIEVRFRLCRDEADDVKFICKVDYPGDVEHKGAWRWWSPLLTTPGELHMALEEGLEMRRRRNGLPPLRFAAPPRKTSRRGTWTGTSSRSTKVAAPHRRAPHP
jgi:hypothetical protein